MRDQPLPLLASPNHPAPPLRRVGVGVGGKDEGYAAAPLIHLRGYPGRELARQLTHLAAHRSGTLEARVAPGPAFHRAASAVALVRPLLRPVTWSWCAVPCTIYRLLGKRSLRLSRRRVSALRSCAGIPSAWRTSVTRSAGERMPRSPPATSSARFVNDPPSAWPAGRP